MANQEQNVKKGMGDASTVFGPDTWRSLKPSILSNEGKLIVSSDPDLSDETMQKLLNHYGNEIKEYTWHFGENGKDDTGLALVSMCIKDNPKSTLAELTARYADLRGIPFLETALALKRLQETQGLPLMSMDDNLPSTREWTPTVANVFTNPPTKKAPNPVLGA